MQYLIGNRPTYNMAVIKSVFYQTFNAVAYSVRIFVEINYGIIKRCSVDDVIMTTLLAALVVIFDEYRCVLKYCRVMLDALQW